MLSLHWHNPEAKNYVDLIPDSWLLSDCRSEPSRHIVKGPRGGVSFAMCDLTVAGKVATLDYTKHSNFNDGQGWDVGVLRIAFSSIDRSAISSVRWQDPGERFTEAPLTVSWIKNPLSDLDLLDTSEQEGAAKLIRHLRRERKQRLVKRKKAAVLSEKGKLGCEVCGFDFAAMYPNLGEDFCEVHHVTHIARGVRDTELADLAILCSNCHRMIHRLGPETPLHELKAILRSHRRS